MEEFRELKIGEIETNDGFGSVDGPFGSNLPALAYTTDGIPVIRGKNLSLGKERFKNYDFVFVSADTAGKLARSSCKTGDIVFTKKGTLGQTGIIPQDSQYESYLLSSNQMRLRLNKKIADPLYVYYFMSSDHSRNRILADAMTTGVPKINLGYLRNFRVLLPKLENQRKIAAILSAYDDLIEKNKRRIALLEGIAEEIYREWFVRFRFPGHKTAEFEKGIPKDWVEGCLDDIATMVFGQSPKSEYYNANGEGLPFHQGVGSYGNRFPNHETYCSITGRTANENDILFSVRAPVGRLNIADTKLTIGRGLSAICHKKNQNSYLFYLLKVTFANEDMIGNGAIFNSVGKDELKGFKIFIPTNGLTEEFDKKVSVIDEQITRLIQAQRNLTKTKNNLLPRLISGKLSVENLDIQFPPSMLEEDTSKVT